MLHVATAQLDDISIVGHQRHVSYGQRFSDNQQTKFIGDIPENF